MKNIKIYIILTIYMSLITACNDEWNNELYTKLVSFKAPINNEGIANIYLRYTKNGEVEYNLPVIVSGSQENDRDLTVKVAVDNDTLGILNQERFQYRTDLFFKQLPDQFYELPSSTCFIPKGSHTENYKVKFKFENLDLTERWVLPLTIEDDASYKSNHRNGWRKALLYVNPFNDYSGSYSATAMNVFFEGESISTVTSTRTARVVDEKSVFFYAGIVDEGAEERADYKIIMEFGEATENSNGSVSGILNVYAANPEIDFELIDQPTYSIRKTADAVQPYLVREYCTVNIRYRYNDITSIPDLPIRYRAEGSMTMERLKNTLIPDEDQAIQW